MPESHPLEHQALPGWKAFLAVLGVLALLIIAIFAASHFYTPRQPSKLVYNNFAFVKKGDAWHTQWQRDKQLYDVSLRYNPLEVENVSVGGTGLNATFQQLPFYITFDPDEERENFKYLGLAVGELGLNLVRGLGAEIETACTKNLSTACANHSIVTCADGKAVFYIHTANQTRVQLLGNCLIIQGQGVELVKAVDRVLYHFYRIMP